MNEIVLVKPSSSYIEEIKAYKEEMLRDGSSFDGTASLNNYEDINEWINKNILFENKDTCPSNLVPAYQYLAINSNNKVVGMIQLRHHIDHPILSVWGGHIGYSVKPSERRKGYAKAMLKLVLEEAKKHHLTKVLVTCNHDNLGSNKTILANGGVFEKTIELEGTLINRYWINIE